MRSVAAVKTDVVDIALGQAEFDGGAEDAFGAVGVSDFDEVAEPLFKDFGSEFRQ